MAQSEPKNVLGSVMISIQNQTAMHARMGTFAEVFVRSFLETGATLLTGLVGVHKQDGSMSSTCSLGTHHLRETCPPSIMNRFIETALGCCTVGQELAR